MIKELPLGNCVDAMLLSSGGSSAEICQETRPPRAISLPCYKAKDDQEFLRLPHCAQRGSAAQLSRGTRPENFWFNPLEWPAPRIVPCVLATHSYYFLGRDGNRGVA